MLVYGRVAARIVQFAQAERRRSDRSLTQARGGSVGRCCVSTVVAVKDVRRGRMGGRVRMGVFDLV